MANGSTTIYKSRQLGSENNETGIKHVGSEERLHFVDKVIHSALWTYFGAIVKQQFGFLDLILGPSVDPACFFGPDFSAEGNK